MQAAGQTRSSHLPASPVTAAPTTTPASASSPVPLKSALKIPATIDVGDDSGRDVKDGQRQDDDPDPFNEYGFINRVSFNATDNISKHGGGVGSEQAFTLRARTKNFKRTRESRTFLVACDLNEYSIHALNWALDSLIEDGDELVVLRVFDPSLPTSTSSSSQLPLSSLSSSPPASHAQIPLPFTSTITTTARDEAHALIQSVMERNNHVPRSSTSTPLSTPLAPTRSQDSFIARPRAEVQPTRELSVTVEFVVGKVFQSIQAMIAVYRPDSLVVGTRGRTDSVWKSAFIGSVSKWCVANSPIPIIVVRPPKKVKKTKVKRENRRTYHDMVEADQPKKITPPPAAPPSPPVEVKSNPTGIPFVKSASMDDRPSNSSLRFSKKGLKLTKTNTMPSS